LALAKRRRLFYDTGFLAIYPARWRMTTLRFRKYLIFAAASLLVPCLALAQDEDTNSEDATYALIDAVIDADTREVRNQLGEGADASVKTDEGLPVVGYAAMKGEADIVAALVEAGADLEGQDKTGATALMYAAQFNNNEIVTALIEASASVNAADNLGWTPLMRAVIGGNLDAVTALMEAGADVNATDFFGRSAVRIAEGRDLDEIVGALNGTPDS